MCRYARVFVFCYTLALHLLIMGVLARWSHGHSQTLAATELLQAKQVCTCSSFADVCGAKQCLHCCVLLSGVLNPVVPMKYALLHHILLWMHLSSFANSIAFAKGQTRYMSSTSTSLQLVGNAGEFDLHHFRLVCLIMLGYLQPLDVANASQLLQDSRLPGGG